MSAELHEIDRRCHLCNSRLLAAFLPSSPDAHGGQMWRKSAPVIMCGKCDFSAVPNSAHLHASLHSRPRLP